jgi:transposase
MEDLKMSKKAMGIDVDSKELNVCVVKDEKKENSIWEKMKNDKKGFAEVLKLLRKEMVELVFMEATGGYEQSIAVYLASNGIEVYVKNPWQVKQFAKGIGLMCKNDKVDAFALGRMAQVVEVKPGMQLSPNQIKLKQLVTRREQITEILTKEKGRLKLVIPETQASIKRHIEFLEEEQESLDELISEMIKKDEVMAQKRKVITQFKGIGKITAAALIGFLPELGYIGNKEICHLAGLAPMDNDSGAKKGKRFISGGRPRARRALYMPAWVAVQRDPNIRSIYERLIKAGKCKKVAIVAIMRKLLVRANAAYRRHLWEEQIKPFSY